MRALDGGVQRYFWPISIGVALVWLILVLGYAWYALVAANKRRPFPPTQALCPDGWARLRDGRCRCKNGVNAGELPPASWTIDPNAPAMRGLDSRRAWARKHRVQWDGVSNF